MTHQPNVLCDRFRGLKQAETLELPSCARLDSAEEVNSVYDTTFQVMIWGSTPYHMVFHLAFNKGCIKDTRPTTRTPTGHASDVEGRIREHNDP